MLYTVDSIEPVVTAGQRGQSNELLSNSNIKLQEMCVSLLVIFLIRPACLMYNLRE